MRGIRREDRERKKERIKVKQNTVIKSHVKEATDWLTSNTVTG